MISIIVATDDDLLIGKKDSKNGMPWHNKEDLQHFKKTTLKQFLWEKQLILLLEDHFQIEKQLLLLKVVWMMNALKLEMI